MQRGWPMEKESGLLTIEVKVPGWARELVLVFRPEKIQR